MRKRGGSSRRLACWGEGIGGDDQNGFFGLPRVRSRSRVLVTRPRPVAMLNGSDLLGMRPSADELAEAPGIDIAP